MFLRTGAGLPLVLLAASLFTSTLPTAFAQEARGTITGRVLDPTGSSVPKATVEITNKAQGVKQSVTTNDAGLYLAPYVLPGQYEIVVSAPGFKRARREAVDVNVGDRLNVDITLEIGATDQTITVTAESPLLETSTASMGQVVDSKRISELPIAHGQPFALIGLTAGASFTGSQTLDRPYEPTHITNYSVNGVYGNRGDITIDGIPSTGTANANEVTASYVPPQDIVQEFKVQTATFDAQFGNTEGAVTNVSLKSGTNEFHGSAYYYKQHPSFFANNWFANANRQPRSEFSYDRVGGSFLGPVVLPGIYDGHNKTFFMYGPEMFKDNRPRNNGTPTTLTDAMKGGDFSALLNPALNPNNAAVHPYQIFNPFTRRETSPGVYTADPFPNNVIPASMINPVSKALLGYWPSPTSPGAASLSGQNNFQQPNILEETDYFNHTIRLDHNLSESQRMFFRWSSYDRNSFYNNYFGNLATGESFKFIARSASLDFVKVLTPTTVLNTRYGYNRFIRVTANNPENEGFDITSLGFPASYASQVADFAQFPRIDITGYQGTGIGGEYRPNDLHSFVATIVQSLGGHSVKYGTEFRSYRENATFNGNDSLGRFEFTDAYTRGPLNTAVGAPNGLGQSAAAFLLGLPTRSSVTVPSQYSEQSTTWGFFVQDDWRVSNRLSLNLGVRYEFETPLEERYGRSLKGFDPNATLTINGRSFRGAFTVPEGDEGLYKTPKGNIMPRFGFAYTLTPKTVLRGGYGWFYGFLGQRRGDVIRSGFSRTTEFPATNDNVNFVRNLSNVFTTPILQPFAAEQVPSTLIGSTETFTFFNQEPEQSQQQKWQLSVQRELPGSWLIDVAYVGNRGTRIEITRDINALGNNYLSTDATRTARQLENDSYLRQNLANPYAGQFLVGNTGANNTQITRQQLFRPFPYYGNLNTSTNQGYTWYHSFQLNAQKRFSHGYTLQVSYTRSKFMEAVAYLNPADPMPHETISGSDRPNRFVVNGIYELPFGRGKAFLGDTNGVVSRIVGGWQLNGIYTFQSGAPIGFGNIIFNGNFEDLKLDNPTRERWFNTDAGFNKVANQQLLSNVRTFPLRLPQLRADALKNFDLSLFKNTSITERVNLQFRAEALNAFNSVQFNAPDTSPTSATFGVSNNVENYARRLQLSIRLQF